MYISLLLFNGNCKRRHTVNVSPWRSLLLKVSFSSLLCNINNLVQLNKEGKLIQCFFLLHKANIQPAGIWGNCTLSNSIFIYTFCLTPKLYVKYQTLSKKQKKLFTFLFLHKGHPSWIITPDSTLKGIPKLKTNFWPLSNKDILPFKKKKHWCNFLFNFENKALGWFPSDSGVYFNVRRGSF